MSEAEQRSFGNVIRVARKKRGLTQVELGAKSGLSRPTIARVEADKVVTTSTLAKIAQVLGLKLEYRDGG